MDKYKQLGGPSGFLGSPTSNELTNPNNTGKRTSFANDSSIYWSSSTDAHQIGGLVGARWATTGYESGSLGYPKTDELKTPDGAGRYNAFQSGGSIYWTSATGAWDIPFKQFVVWASQNYEKGSLGYPTAGPQSTSNQSQARAKAAPNAPVSTPPSRPQNRAAPNAAAEPQPSFESMQNFQTGAILIGAGTDRGYVLKYTP